MIGTIFGGVGRQSLKAPVMPWHEDFDINDPTFSDHNQRVASNWIGALNFIAVDSFMSMSMALVMVMMNTTPVVQRERANNMYSATTNFMIYWFSAAISFLPYPIITGTLTF